MNQEIKETMVAEPTVEEIAATEAETEKILTGKLDLEKIPSTENLKYYMYSINKYPLLSKEDEIKLAKAAKSGDEAARATLINSNLKLVVAIAKEKLGKGVNLEDLIQDGSVGLMMAVDKFDPDKGFRFSTYAGWWIRDAISKSVEANGKTIRIPGHVTDKINYIKKVIDDLERALGRDVKEKEIQIYTAGKYSDEELGMLLKMIKQPKNVSLDATIDDEDKITVGDTVGSEDEAIKEKIDKDDQVRIIKEILSDLKPIERKVLTIKYGLGGGEKKTLEETADLLVKAGEKRYTKERIRQIEAEAVEKIQGSKEKMKKLQELL